MVIDIPTQFQNKTYIVVSYINKVGRYTCTIYKNFSINGFILAFTRTSPYLSTLDNPDLISIININDSFVEEKTEIFLLEDLKTTVTVNQQEIGIS